MRLPFVAFTFITLLATVAGLPNSAAQSPVGQGCVGFEEGIPSDPYSGFSGVNASLSIQTPGPPGPSPQYLQTTDAAGASYVKAPPFFTGSYAGLATCSALCFDVRLFNDGSGTPDGAAPHTLLAPSVTLVGTSGLSATFVASPNLYVTEDLGTKPGWRHVCAPLGPLTSTGAIPTTQDGSWTMSNGIAASWATLLANITELRLSAFDVTPNQTEKAGYDNVCVLPTGGCQSSVNKDMMNNTGQPVDNLEILLDDFYSTIDWHFDGNFGEHVATGFSVSAIGSNTLLTWTGIVPPVPNGDIFHAGFRVPGTGNIRDIIWTAGNSFAGCVKQVKTAVQFLGDLPVAFIQNTVGNPPTCLALACQCAAATRYVGNVSVEWFKSEVALDLLNARTTSRIPFRTDVFPNGPVQMLAGEHKVVEFPLHPPQDASYGMLRYTVSASPSLGGPDDTIDFAQFGIQDSGFQKPPTQFEIRILSSRPDTVSGGDALAQVRVPVSTPLSDVLVRLNGQDVSSAFRAVDSSTLQGLVIGLHVGGNALAAGPRSTGQILAKILVTNHPISGPIFSGPHQTPFVCQTQTFALPVTGGTLGPGLDTDCSIATRIDYAYMSSGGTFKPLANPISRPADLVQTTTNEGRTVDYVVRVETGTINRAIYQIAILHDPKSDAAITPWARPAGWNSRLVFSFGGGCGAGYRQGTTTGGVLNDLWLSKGYAAAASSLNVFGTNCDDVISAETTMMVKEHFIENYGLPRYTIGWGTSGGSMQQHLLTHNYPGLLDGITPGRSFPDALTFFIPIADCPLLARTIGTSAVPWSTDQKIAVAGWGNWDFCIGSGSGDWAVRVLALLNPRAAVSDCNATVPAALLYDPVSNPNGARCTWFDNAVNIFGRNPATGFALRAIDSVGIQYGLQALNAGQISVEQFLDLNARIGGYDIDGNFITGRTVADLGGLRIAYQTGRLDSGDGALGSVPMIDYRAYRDFVSDPHDSVRSRIMRARLIAQNGDAANQVILVSPYDGTTAGAAMFVALQTSVLRLMDQWLANIANDAAPFSSLHEKVVRNKPAELVDACYDAAGGKVTDQSVCQELYPPHGNPRLAAGEPLSNDVLKCQLKAVTPADYAISFNTSQFMRLQAIFPDGVCDYSKPGVEQQPSVGTWLSYPTPGSFFQLKP